MSLWFVLGIVAYVLVLALTWGDVQDISQCG